MRSDFPPPYWALRDYGANGQLGLEKTPEQYVSKMVEVFKEVKRILTDDGTVWLNMGSTYAGGSRGGNTNDFKNDESKYVSAGVPAGFKKGDEVDIPFFVSEGLRRDGWYKRSTIIWSKPNPMPESVKNRPTKAHEFIFLMTKSHDYFYDIDAARVPMKESTKIRYETGWNGDERRNFPGGQHNNFSKFMGTEKALQTIEKGRNLRTVWEVPLYPSYENHPAAFPEKLIEPCILLGSKKESIVFDPFTGSGTTGSVSLRLGRKVLGTEINPDYCRIAQERIDRERAQLKLSL